MQYADKKSKDKEDVEFAEIEAENWKNERIDNDTQRSFGTFTKGA